MGFQGYSVNYKRTIFWFIKFLWYSYQSACICLYNSDTMSQFSRSYHSASFLGPWIYDFFEFFRYVSARTFEWNGNLVFNFYWDFIPIDLCTNRYSCTQTPTCVAIDFVKVLARIAFSVTISIGGRAKMKETLFIIWFVLFWKHLTTFTFRKWLVLQTKLENTK